jgi:hypothetical protein
MMNNNDNFFINSRPKEPRHARLNAYIIALDNPNNTMKLHSTAGGSILTGMNELDDQWANMLSLARQKAAEGGRSDVVDYLKLRAENDLVRDAGIRWLFDSMISIATTREGAASGIAVERVDPHNFTYGRANIVGSLLQVRHGVRCLTLEAGWTRTPADGFMKGGALAIGRLVHFGMSKNNSDLMLVRSGSNVVWREVPTSGDTAVFDSERLLAHFHLFLGM